MSDLLTREELLPGHMFQQLLQATHFQESGEGGGELPQPGPGVAQAAASGVSIARNTNLFLSFLSWFKIPGEKVMTKNPQAPGHLA